MENASKALIIAGAILLSISIIGIGMFVFNMASEAMGKVNLAPQEIAAYNGDFDRYLGTQKGTSVKTLCTVVRDHNLANIDDPSRQIVVQTSSAADVTEAPDAANATGTTSSEINTIKAGILSGKTYTVDFGYDTNSGLIVAVGIVEK